MNSLRVLIVDDEPLIRLGLRSGLARIGDIEIAGECEDGEQAVEAILSARPNVVLLDVQMPGRTGLDVVREVGPERMPLVIFVTAYDEYAVTAFEMNAVDYLLKPFDEERLRRAIERARERLEGRDRAGLVQQLRALIDAKPRPWARRLVVKNGDRYDLVAVDSIDWIESANNYVQLHCGDRTHLMGETLSNIEKQLDPEKFARVHRCRIVNVTRVAAVHPMLHGAWELELRQGARIGTGRQYRDAVQRLLSS